MEYPLLITEFGQFTCHATTIGDFDDGFAVHCCPTFDTPQEVAVWVYEHETTYG